VILLTVSPDVFIYTAGERSLTGADIEHIENVQRAAPTRRAHRHRRIAGSNLFSSPLMNVPVSVRRVAVLTLLSPWLLVEGPAVAQRGRESGDANLQALMTHIRTRSYDRIPAIDDPEFVTAEKADVYLRHGDSVIGVELAGEARAYPVEFLNGREVVNDSLGGALLPSPGDP